MLDLHEGILEEFSQAQAWGRLQNRWFEYMCLRTIRYNDAENTRKKFWKRQNKSKVNLANKRWRDSQDEDWRQAQREYQRGWRQKNRDKRREYQRKYLQRKAEEKNSE